MSELKDRLEKIAAMADEKNRSNNMPYNKPVNEVNSEVDDLLNDINTNEDVANINETITSEVDEINDTEFETSRNEAFASVAEQFTTNKQNVAKETHKETTDTINENDRQLTAAERYEMKNSIIKRHEKPVIKEDDIDNDPNAALIKGMVEMDKQSAEMSKMLYAMKEQEEIAKETSNAADQEDSTSDSVVDILANIEETNAKKDLDLEENSEDLTEMLEKLESQKVYATYEPTEEYTGPADYVVEEDKEYQAIVENVLDENNIRIVKASNKEKNAILERFSNSGNNVTVPLINSGIYITVSGASANEIISMNNITGNSMAETTLKKLSMVNEHIVGSSIGKMRLAQLIKVVSYHDIETLWYALYAATYPEESEISRTCSRCGNDYYIKTNTRDLMINPEDFVDDAKEILNNVTQYNILLERSVLNKVVKKTLDKGNIIVYIKHPSIESYVSTSNNIDQDVIRNNQSTLIDICYSIDKLLVRKSGYDYVEFKDPNKIIEIINKVKDTNVLYELLDAIEEVRPNALPAYGYKKTTCPHCGFTNQQEAFSIQELLFTSAQQESEMATLRWAAKLQQRRQQKKK